MIISLADWQFSVDPAATRAHTIACSQDHCTCAYCRNYYEAVDAAYPQLRPVLDKFGVQLEGPSELMPFEPTLVAACYRVTGQILRKGGVQLHIDGIPLRPEAADSETFFLWVGEMALPWLQSEPEEEVISPANEPEFMDRMMARWLQTHDPLESAGAM